MFSSATSAVDTDTMNKVTPGDTDASAGTQPVDTSTANPSVLQRPTIRSSVDF